MENKCKFVRRTCGSVRSSLSASAWPATARSKAAETTYFCLTTRKCPRGSFRHCQRQRGGRVRLNDMSNSSELLQAPAGKKRMRLCNGADRSSNITPLRKQADFQLVVDDETTYRIFAERNCKWTQHSVLRVHPPAFGALSQPQTGPIVNEQ